MNITVLSGGSGNDSLVRGLKQFNKDINLNVVVNAYDNGKSTGVCRAVTDTLGVSDIRKNHSRMYSAVSEFIDKRVLEFYDNRYTLDHENPLLDALSYLEQIHIGCYWDASWGIDTFENYVIRFFESIDDVTKYSFKSFNLANIVYAQMYKELGYEKTNNVFCKMLGIEDFVILNSFDNVFLNANTNTGEVLTDEGDIVELASHDVKITSTFYTPAMTPTLNPKAIEAVLNCDLLIISTGTFWSSIYPTLQYGDFYKYVNESKACKIWTINNTFDKDSYGVTTDQFAKHLADLGLDLSQFRVLQNKDAIHDLRLDVPNLNIVRKHMGNEDGKHNGALYAKALLTTYYNLDDISSYDKILFDFDDTLWARDTKSNKVTKRDSIRNLQLLATLGDKAEIITGNSYDALKQKLHFVFGTKLSGFNVPIWTSADASMRVRGKVINTIEKLALPGDTQRVIDELINFGIDENNIQIFLEKGKIYNIRIKPLTTLERTLLTTYLNSCLFSEKEFMYYEARIAGTTTVDIVHKHNVKSEYFNYNKYWKDKTLYIGDEVDSGNDKDIAKECTTSVCTSGVTETRVLLELLVSDLMR